MISKLCQAMEARAQQASNYRPSVAQSPNFFVKLAMGGYRGGGTPRWWRLSGHPLREWCLSRRSTSHLDFSSARERIFRQHISARPTDDVGLPPMFNLNISRERDTAPEQGELPPCRCGWPFAADNIECVRRRGRRRALKQRRGRVLPWSSLRQCTYQHVRSSRVFEWEKSHREDVHSTCGFVEQLHSVEHTSARCVAQKRESGCVTQETAGPGTVWTLEAGVREA